MDGRGLPASRRAILMRGTHGGGVGVLRPYS